MLTRWSSGTLDSVGGISTATGGAPAGSEVMVGTRIGRAFYGHANEHRLGPFSGFFLVKSGDI